MFVFAWDNLAICYRKTNQIDKSIEAYQQSLKINPYGEVPLQNIAVAYEYKKEYDKSIEAYQLYLKNYPDAVEAYYGIGRILFFYKNEEEEALENMCKAYNLYTKMSSPYRVDAEKVISQIYAQMKKQKKEKKFNEILKRNHLSPQ
jgi:tetratricopeptide (TPR) repeat protein